MFFLVEPQPLFFFFFFVELQQSITFFLVEPQLVVELQQSIAFFLVEPQPVYYVFLIFELQLSKQFL